MWLREAGDHVRHLLVEVLEHAVPFGFSALFASPLHFGFLVAVLGSCGCSRRSLNLSSGATIICRPSVLH